MARVIYVDAQNQGDFYQHSGTSSSITIWAFNMEMTEIEKVSLLPLWVSLFFGACRSQRPAPLSSLKTARLEGGE